MNIHTAKLFLPLVQALADGETIQGRTSPKIDWVDFEVGEEVDFTDPPDHYRIKPEIFECWLVTDEKKHIEVLLLNPEWYADNVTIRHMREVE